MVLEAFATMDLALLNHGNRHTFRRAGLGSVVDLTFTIGSSFRLTRCRLSEGYTGSDHLAIFCDLGCPPWSQAQIAAQTRLKYKKDTLDIPRAVPTHGEQTRSRTDGSGADEATEGHVRRQHANEQDA